MEAIVLLVLLCVISLIWFLLRVTFAVTVADPRFAAKAFASGLASAAVGYLAEGQVVIRIVLWGAGGLVLYMAYKYVFERN